MYQYGWHGTSPDLSLLVCGTRPHVNGLAQDCGNSIAAALELPQSWAKPWMYGGCGHACWTMLRGGTSIICTCTVLSV